MQKTIQKATLLALEKQSNDMKQHIRDQIKKHGKIPENFICLPDPDNITEWYYVVYGFDQIEFRGGYFMGVIKCPALVTEEGRLMEVKEDICRAITNMRPEAWNPAWKDS